MIFFDGVCVSSVICGLTQFTTRAHLARATLESVCYQTKDIVQVMAREVGVHLKALQVDGGLTNSDVLAQLQADILGIPISKYFQLYYIYIIFIILLLNYIYIRFTARYGSLVHAF